MTEINKRYYRIDMKCLNEYLYVYWDLDNFMKDYKLDESDKSSRDVGLQFGNGIWIDLNYKNRNGIIVHELSHYLAWLFDLIFQTKKELEVTEIRSRMHEYLFNKIVNYFDKNLAPQKDIM